nr:cytochrome C oxidase subunit II [Alkalibacillus aidingensis]
MITLNVQQPAWIITLLVSSLVFIVFWFILKNSKDREEDYDGIKKKGFKIRNVYFVILFSVLLGATFYTITDLPYDRPPEFVNATEVEVEALQFGWDFSQEEFEVGEKYAFHVTSQDVNHGIGFYDEDMMLLTQTQAMPDYTNTVYVEFEEPGTYQILCLEYCGAAHHLMIHEIEVK